MNSHFFKIRLMVSLAALASFTPWAAEPSAAKEVWAAGITEPILSVLLSAPVAGTVSVRHFKEGDLVRKGQVILELDKKLEELTVTRRKLVVDTLKTDLAGTRHVFETTKSVSKDDLDKKELEYQVAVVDYDTAVEQLRKRHLMAPFDGQITDIIPEVGEDCKAQDPVVRMVDTQRCYFICNIEAKLGGGLKSGQKVRLVVEVGVGKVPVEGELVYVAPVVDAASGLMRVKAIFSNNDGKIRPGVPGQMRLEADPNVR